MCTVHAGCEPDQGGPSRWTYIKVFLPEKGRVRLNMLRRMMRNTIFALSDTQNKMTSIAFSSVLCLHIAMVNCQQRFDDSPTVFNKVQDVRALHSL